MILTDPAMYEMERGLFRLVDRLSQALGRSRYETTPGALGSDAYQSLQRAELSSDERRARAIALRGLSEARSGAIESARETFAAAASLDPALDLSRLPSFWQLPKPVHEAVVDAYLDADRGRDAADLTARLRTRFRPRLLRSQS